MSEDLVTQLKRAYCRYVGTPYWFHHQETSTLCLDVGSKPTYAAHRHRTATVSTTLSPHRHRTATVSTTLSPHQHRTATVSTTQSHRPEISNVCALQHEQFSVWFAVLTGWGVWFTLWSVSNCALSGTQVGTNVAGKHAVWYTCTGVLGKCALSCKQVGIVVLQGNMQFSIHVQVF